ncbi:MAG: tRNA dihydrouridine synthase DusB [Phycisphaerales bacterium]|nr:tRNA dihydrouridine synthase DusB [Phycisphaerales bacterium]
MVQIGKITLPDFPLLLAPMEDVSDPPFRALCKDHGADMMYTEFISSEGLVRDAIKSMKKLDVFPEERPIGIQIFGGDEEVMGMASAIVSAVEPDLVDINFGCPVKKVVCKGAGAAVLKDIPLMVKLTKAVIQSTTLPVTVKTRLGWDDHSINIEEVALRLQDVGIKALTIHGRTRSQLYKGEANWNWIAKIKQNRNITIPIFGNGDIDSPQKALLYKKEYGVDGIMIGRAAIGYPWIFNEIKALRAGKEIIPPTIEHRVIAIKKHLQKSVAWKGTTLGILEMRKHYANYLKGYPHVKPVRQLLVTANELSSLEKILDDCVKQFA